MPRRHLVGTIAVAIGVAGCGSASHVTATHATVATHPTLATHPTVTTETTIGPTATITPSKPIPAPTKTQSGAQTVVGITQTATAQTQTTTTLANGDIAVVAGMPISVGTYNHWLRVAAKSTDAKPSTPAIVPSDPPEFTACIAATRKRSSTLHNAPSTLLRRDCQTLFHNLNAQVLTFLIQADWYDVYAKDLNLTPPEAEVESDAAADAQAQFSGQKKFAAYLARTGQNTADILLRTRVSLDAAALIKAIHGTQTTLAQRAQTMYRNRTICAPLYRVSDCS